jgi:IS5 family transposase
MDTQIIAVYCLCDDLLRALGHREDRQCHMSEAEVMTIAIVAGLHYRGNFATTCRMLHEQGYMPRMLSASRLNRRLHRVKPLFLTLFAILAEQFKQWNQESVYVIDTFPIAACDNYRIRRSRRYRGQAYRGYIASKKRYFYGVKLHLLVTVDMEPVEFFLTPGAESDVAGLDWFDFDLPAGSQIIGDKGYNDYELEDVLKEADLQLLPMRKSNSKRPLPAWWRYLQARWRKAVETAGSLLERLLPKSIHAVTQQGFELKVVLFVLAVSFNRLDITT